VISFFAWGRAGCHHVAVYPTRRSYGIPTIAASAGVIAILWLLATSTSHVFFSAGKRDPLSIICAPVLWGPGPAKGYPLDRTEYYDDEDVVRIKDAKDDRIVPACESVRTQMLGWSVLIAIPTGILATLAVLRRREYLLVFGPITHDEMVKDL
jgi:hypothetical protein